MRVCVNISLTQPYHLLAIRWNSCGAVITAANHFDGDGGLAAAKVSPEELMKCAPKPIDLVRLKELIDEARVPPQRRRGGKRRMANLAGEWHCIACEKWFPPEAFYVQGMTQKPRSRCKSCVRKQMMLYYRTLRGGIMRIMQHAKSHAVAKGKEMTLTFKHVIDMLEDQRGRCAYSGVPMEFLLPNSHWRMSLERVNNNEGYSSENCVLIAAEFNSSDWSRQLGVKKDAVVGTAQWSAHKVKQLHSLRRTNIDLAFLAHDIVAAKLARPKVLSNPRCKVTTSCLPQIIGHSYCPTCCKVKPCSAFNTGRSFCQQCEQGRKHAYRATLRGHFHNLLGGARFSSNLRGQEFKLDLWSLLRMLERQQGRCFYSGIPLQYKRVHTDWRLSLERLNNDVGYTEDNCVLIAVEFNTPDYSRNKAVTEVFGTAQWSRAKVQHVWGCLDDQQALKPISTALPKKQDAELSFAAE